MKFALLGQLGASLAHYHSNRSTLLKLAPTKQGDHVLAHHRIWVTDTPGWLKRQLCISQLIDLKNREIVTLRKVLLTSTPFLSCEWWFFSNPEGNLKMVLFHLTQIGMTQNRGQEIFCSTVHHPSQGLAPPYNSQACILGCQKREKWVVGNWTQFGGAASGCGGRGPQPVSEKVAWSEAVLRITQMESMWAVGLEEDPRRPPGCQEKADGLWRHNPPFRSCTPIQTSSISTRVQTPPPQHWGSLLGSG